MRLWKDESGQALVMAILFMTMLLAFMALAVDVGILFRARRAVQTAADATAIAAAMDYKLNNTNKLTYARNAGYAAASANGFTNGTGGVVVTITPLSTGLYNYCGGACFEAKLKVPNPTFFMSLFNYNSIDVGARAVAGPPASGGWENCMILLGGTGADFNNTGSGTISMPSCGFVDNSNGTNAFSNAGALTMTAKSIGIVGQIHNIGAETLSPTPVTGTTPSGDPLNLDAPSMTGCGAALSYSGSGNATLNPGCYNGASASGSVNVTLTPGLYEFNGPIQLSGSATFRGTGVTIFFNNTFTMASSVTMNLSAPTSGQWNGILFFESPSDSSTVALNGASASNLQGILYMPAGTLDVGGASSMQLDAAFVVSRLINSGALSLTLNDYLTQNPNSPLATVTLLE